MNVEYLSLWGSNHRPILVRFLAKIRSGFKFDKWWIGKDGFREMILQGWSDPGNFHPPDLHERIAKCRKAISQWKCMNPSNSSVRIEEIKDKLEEAQLDDVISSDEILQLKWSLCAAFRDEELYWKQKSRGNWLRAGDRNTKFFHAKTKQRRAQNMLTKLKTPRGGWAESEEDIERVAASISKFSSPLPILGILMMPSGMLLRKLLRNVMSHSHVTHQMRK